VSHNLLGRWSLRFRWISASLSLGASSTFVLLRSVGSVTRTASFIFYWNSRVVQRRQLLLDDRESGVFNKLAGWLVALVPTKEAEIVRARFGGKLEIGRPSRSDHLALAPQIFFLVTGATDAHANGHRLSKFEDGYRADGG